MRRTPRQNKPGSVPGSADAPVGPSVNPADEGVGAPGDTSGVTINEWYSRGYLPHRDRLHLLQSVTFRLADSLPQSRLQELEAELLQMDEGRRDSHRRKQIETWLDAGMGCCALRHPEAANCVQDALLHFHGERYQLLAWVIMPNHVHVLVKPLTPLFKIVQTWKSISARRLLSENERLSLGIPEPDRVWMREYWDRFIRDEGHLKSVTEYIHQNPVKAGLCERAEQWSWSSASARGSAEAHARPSVNLADEGVGAPGVALPAKAGFAIQESAG